MSRKRSGHRNSWAGRWLAVTVSLIAVPSPGQALSPLSPALDPTSRLAVVGTLSDHGISDVASSAVLISLLAVLGSEPAVRRYRYREPYPHLPDVDAEASLAHPPCVEVRLTTVPKVGRPVLMMGTYCLVDAQTLTWTATILQVDAR